MKNVNTPIDRIGKCFANARTAVVAKALGYLAVIPTVDAKTSQMSMMFGTYLSHPDIIVQSMVIACCSSLVRLNEFDPEHIDAGEVMSGAWQLVGKRADESEAIAEASIALRRAQQLVALYRFHIDQIASLMIDFDRLLEALPRKIQLLESIDKWPEADTNGRPTTVDAKWIDRLPNHIQVAIHEAGHVVAHAFFGDTIVATSIDGNEDSLGVVMLPLHGCDDVAASRAQMISLAAGAVASARGCPYAYPGGDDDFKQANREACSLFGKINKTSEGVHRELKTAEQRAKKIVHKFWPNVIRVAEALLSFQWAATQIPRFTEPLSSLDETKAFFTPTIPFSGDTKDDEITSDRIFC